MPTLLADDRSFSFPVPLEEIRDIGCFTVLPVRRHNDLQAFKDAREEMKALWQKYMEDGFVDRHMGTEDDVTGDWCAVAYPMTRPDRIRGLTWVYTFFFLLDDKQEYISRTESHAINLCLEAIIHSEGNHSPTTPLERCFIAVVKEFLSVDHVRGMHALRTWATWLRSCDNVAISSFTTMEDFLDHRLRNVGYPPMRGMMPYVMDMDISDADEELISAFLLAAGKSVCMTNDYLSFEKEQHQAEQGLGHMMNTTTLLMRTRGMSMEDARTEVKTLAMKYEKEAMDEREKLLGLELPENVRRYVHAMSWVVGGTVLWSTTCPRYHAWKDADVDHTKATIV